MIITICYLNSLYQRLTVSSKQPGNGPNILSSESFRFIVYLCIYIYVQGAHNKFPEFFRMGTFIDNTHMKL